MLDAHHGRPVAYQVPWWFRTIDAAKYLGCDPTKLAREPLPWLSWTGAHWEITADFEAAVEAEERGEAPPVPRSGGHAAGETPPRDNRSKGDGGFAARMAAALERREERGIPPGAEI